MKSANMNFKIELFEMNTACIIGYLIMRTYSIENLKKNLFFVNLKLNFNERDR